MKRSRNLPLVYNGIQPCQHPDAGLSCNTEGNYTSSAMPGLHLCSFHAVASSAIIASLPDEPLAGPLFSEREQGELF